MARASPKPRSGVGASVAANKVKGIRAGLCHDHYSVRQGVEDDDMNVLCLGGRVMGIEVAWDHAQSFISATFSGAERHVRRLTKVARLEDPSTSIKLVDRISSVGRTTVATSSPRRSADGLPRQVTRLSEGGSAAWSKSWVFQVTVRTVPGPRRWRFFLSSDR
ncbi:MAG: RpiB/LacA/LacB family sugar-phosphate isomerase [Isosphaeraceae bacterium]